MEIKNILIYLFGILLVIGIAIAVEEKYDDANYMGYDIYNATEVNVTLLNTTTLCLEGTCRTYWYVYNTSYEYWDNTTLMDTYNVTYDGYEDTANSTAEIQAVAVGGETSGTVGSITLSNTALDDQYIQLDNSTVNTVLTNDPSDWDAIGDVPTATPSDGDTTHLSLADQIYDWVVSLGYITNTYNSSYEWFTNTTIFQVYNSSYEYWTNSTLWSSYNSSYEYWDNATLWMTYNSSYEYWDNVTLTATYNSTYAGYDSTYNSTYESTYNSTYEPTYNASYDSTYNTTYDAKPDTDTANTSAQMITAINQTDYYYQISSKDVTCTNCLTGTEIAELTDADISNTLTCSNMEGTDWGTLTNGKWCIYDSAGTEVDCNVEPVTDTDTANTTAEMISAINSTDFYYQIFAKDLTCTNCLTGTEIAELSDADISNTLTCSILTDDNTYAKVAGETFTGQVNFTYLNISGCPDNYIWKVDGNSWNCEADAIGEGATDTNASTACSGTTTYLDGENNCDDISGVYVQAADWTTIDNYPGACTNQAVTGLGDTLTCNDITTSNLTVDILTEAELNTISELNTQIADATILISGGTLTNAKWCVYDGTGIDCNVEPVTDTDTANTTAEMITAINQSDYYYQIKAKDLTCTNCLTGTEIAELTDADISNTLTCSVLTDDNTYVTVAGDTMTGDLKFNDNINATFGTGDDVDQYFNATCLIIAGPTSTLEIC